MPASAASLVILVLGSLTALGFGALGCAVALRTGSGEAVQGLFPLFFVFIFLSSSNLPRNLLQTGWFHTVATWNPISYLIEAFRSLYIIGWDSTALWRGFAVAIGLIVISPVRGGGSAAREAPAHMSTAGRHMSPRATPATGGSVWRVALAIAWRSLHTYVRRPDLFVPSLIFPLVFLASFAGGLSALGTVPGFDFPAGYTAFQFVFVLCQAAMFAGLFTGFSLAFDFETGFARRLMLAAEDRRGIALGYALVALTRAVITLTRGHGRGAGRGDADHGRRRGRVRHVWPGGAAGARRLRLGGGRGVPLPLDPGRAADADPAVPDPVPRARVRSARRCSRAGSTRWRA